MASIDGIQVNTQVLLDTAAKVRNINDIMDDKLLQINKVMNELEASWKSDGANDIRNKINGLKPRFAQYKDVVESYCKFLDTSAQSYETTETTIQSNASQFK